MQGHNAAFIADPLGYVRQRTVNNLAWFNEAIHDVALGPLNTALGLNKWGHFDLQPLTLTTVKFRVVGAVVPLGAEVPIKAYWCPFIQGLRVVPGWVDIPKSAPDNNFVFTAGMNGCALIVTDYDATTYRVYHHQHPAVGTASERRDRAIVFEAIHAAHGVRPIVDELGYGEYGVGELKSSPNAFNFLHYDTDRWYLVSQPQTFIMATGVCTRLPDRGVRRALPTAAALAAAAAAAAAALPVVPAAAAIPAAAAVLAPGDGI